MMLSGAVSAQASDLYQANRAQAEAIYNQMSFDEKIGQLVLPNYALLATTVSPFGTACQKALADNRDEDIIQACGLSQIAKYHIGAVLTGGGPYYDDPTLAHWQRLNTLAMQQHRLGNAVDPLLLTGNDAIHGNTHLQGAVVFPHNIGLGVTHDPMLIKQIAFVVGQDSLASGFNWVYMPTVAVVQDLRWGRAYESFGQQGALVKTLGRAYISGLQAKLGPHLTGPIATAKHFIGDGGTQYGFDEGDDAYQGTQDDFWQIHGAGYEGALQAQVATIMVSYNAIDDAHTNNDTQMHFGGKWAILNQFKTTGIESQGHVYRFNGFAVSDWNGVTRSAYFYSVFRPELSLPQIFAKSINAGVDMIMLGTTEDRNPFDFHPELLASSEILFHNTADVVKALKTACQNGLISDERLKDAVVRILEVKLAMKPQTPRNYGKLQATERTLAYQAASQSLVLLKNDHATLPLNKQAIQHVMFVGDTDDLGVQNGGWTITWQGQKGDRYFTGDNQVSSGALTVEQGLKQSLTQARFYHVNDHLAPGATAANSVVIAVVAEAPYAEFMGDVGNSHAVDPWYQQGVIGKSNPYFGVRQNQFLGLRFTGHEAAVIKRLRSKGIPVVTIVYSGRPMILSDGGNKAPLQQSDSVIAAFLPGTLGGKALTAALLGDYHFGAKGQSNTLTFPWPDNMEQVSQHFKQGALFPIGYGLKD